MEIYLSTYPVALDEEARIAKLREYEVLNADHDPELARLIDLVKVFFKTSIVIITFMDEKTQYLKSPHGLDNLLTTAREVAICNYTLLADKVLVVPDLKSDERFKHNTLVTQDPFLRFYAGAPIILNEDNHTYRLGSLCLIDTAPVYTFDDTQAKILEQFAMMVSDSLKLRKAQRLSARVNEMKSVFLANMSHEIRTPMNGIVGMVEMLEETQLSFEQQEYIDNIKFSSENLLAVINGLLDLANIESGKMTVASTAINLSKLCNEVISLSAIKARQDDIILNYHYSEALSPYVKGDPARIKQILASLVNNAIKFTRENGQVTVDVTQMTVDNDTAYDDKYSVNENHDHSNMTLCISVTDTGVGIKTESLEAIFDTYNQADQSTHRLYGGTGLGLSVCKSLVSLMGGRIWADSVVGLGTTFNVLLPLVCIDRTVYEAWHYDDIVGVEPIARSAGHVLLVEDDNVNAMIAKKALGSSGHIVTHVSDGQQAIEKFAECPERYDVILMDHHMPIMNGIQATIRLHELYDASILPPIIALTANTMDGERSKYLEVGMQDYCSKPFKKEQLNALVQYWLTQKAKG